MDFSKFKNAAILGTMQFLNWGICTISWRAVAQGNIPASVITDTTLATLQFFVIKRMVDNREDSTVIAWAGYTFGGVLGTITGIKLSFYFLGA